VGPWQPLNRQHSVSRQSTDRIVGVIQLCHSISGVSEIRQVVPFKKVFVPTTSECFREQSRRSGAAPANLCAGSVSWGSLYTLKWPPPCQLKSRGHKRR
jgi:hypothetical protein